MEKRKKDTFDGDIPPTFAFSFLKSNVYIVFDLMFDIYIKFNLFRICVLCVAFLEGGALL